MFFLEVALGQFMGEGGIGPWKIAPLFQGEFIKMKSRSWRVEFSFLERTAFYPQFSSSLVSFVYMFLNCCFSSRYLFSSILFRTSPFFTIQQTAIQQELMCKA